MEYLITELGSFTLRYMRLTHAMIFKKYDPRVQYFNSVIDHLKDCGLFEAFSQKHFPSKGTKDAEQTVEEPLTLEHFVVPYILLACGLALATMTICAETQFIFKAWSTMKSMHVSINVKEN